MIRRPTGRESRPRAGGAGWEAAWGTCDGFTYSHRTVAVVHDTWYFQEREAGWYLVRSGGRVKGTDSFRNDTTRAQVSAPFVFAVRSVMTSWYPADVDLVAWPHTWTARFNGVNWGLRVPREGAVYQQAGQWTELIDDGVTIDTIIERGVDSFDEEALCRTLGG